MSQFVTANGVNTTLAAAISTTAGTISLSSSVNLPTLQTGQIIPLILRSASAVGVFEIVYGTAISGSSITVDRGMEGTSAQNFNVGDYVLCGPTAGTNALIRAVMNPDASETLPQAYGAAVIPSGLSAAITLTLPNAVPDGTSYVVYGDASYAVTVSVSVDSGSPFIALPDGSTVYSWTIPAGTGQGLHIVFDGTNWRAQTFGQTVVAPATQSNAAVQAGQLLNTPGIIAGTYVNNATSASHTSGLFTAPCDGKAILFGIGGGSQLFDASGNSISASLGSLPVSAASPANYVCFYYAELPMSAGESSSFTVIGTLASSGAIALDFSVFWMPEPLGGG